MIITYGALISKSLEPQLVTYYCKYIEYFILTYQLDEILEVLHKSNSGIRRIKKVGGKILAEMEILDEQKIGHVPPPQPTVTTASPTTVPVVRPIGGTSSGGSAKPDRPIQPKVDVDQKTGFQAVLSPEPTWVKINLNGMTRIFGVKVVPIPINDEDSVIEALMDESKKKSWINLMLKVMSRKIVRLMIRFWKGFTSMIPLLGRSAPSGETTVNDIVYAQSIYRDHLFICLNYATFANSSIFNDANILGHMHKNLNWCSMTFIDQVNQMFYFCMKEFHGSCTSIHYRNLVATMGNEFSKAAEDIEKIQTTASSVFRIHNTKLNKLLGEMYSIEKYMDVKHSVSTSMLNENANTYLSKPHMAAEMYETLNQLKRSSKDQVISKLVRYPTISDSEFMDFARLKCPKLNQSLDFTRQVLTNSLKWLDPNSKEIAIKIIGFKGARALAVGERNRIPNLVVTIKAFAKEAKTQYAKTKDPQLSTFRALIFTMNTTSNMTNLDVVEERNRKEVILDNLFVFLSLIPRVFDDGDEKEV